MFKPNLFISFIVSVALACFCALSCFAEVSQEIDKHMARGEAAIENAQSISDYEDAIKEFKKATELAPNWENAYYNLSLAQEGAGRYKAAVSSLKRYIELTNNEMAAKDAQRKIYKLEYLVEKAEKVTETKKETQPVMSLAEKLEGTWYARFKSSSWGFKFFIPDSLADALL